MTGSELRIRALKALSFHDETSRAEGVRFPAVVKIALALKVPVRFGVRPSRDHIRCTTSVNAGLAKLVRRYGENGRKPRHDPAREWRFKSSAGYQELS